MRMKLLAAGCLFLIGCGTLSKAEPGRMPVDFAMQLLVAPADGRRTQYIVEPDRTLRTAVGGGVREDFYPQPTATLSPRQMQQLWRIIEEERLLEAPQPANDSAACQWTITARGKRYPSSGADAERLTDALKELSGL